MREGLGPEWGMDGGVRGDRKGDKEEWGQVFKGQGMGTGLQRSGMGTGLQVRKGTGLQGSGQLGADRSSSRAIGIGVSWPTDRSGKQTLNSN